LHIQNVVRHKATASIRIIHAIDGHRVVVQRLQERPFQNFNYFLLIELEQISLRHFGDCFKHDVLGDVFVGVQIQDFHYLIDNNVLILQVNLFVDIIPNFDVTIDDGLQLRSRNLTFSFKNTIDKSGGLIYDLHCIILVVISFAS
jgi:hypothetical protein